MSSESQEYVSPVAQRQSARWAASPEGNSPLAQPNSTEPDSSPAGESPAAQPNDTEPNSSPVGASPAARPDGRAHPESPYQTPVAVANKRKQALSPAEPHETPAPNDSPEVLQVRDYLEQWGREAGPGRGRAIEPGKTGKKERPQEFFTPFEHACSLMSHVPDAALFGPAWEPSAGKGTLVAAAMLRQLDAKPKRQPVARFMRKLVQSWHINELDSGNAAFIRRKLRRFAPNPRVYSGDTLAVGAEVPKRDSLSLVITNPPFVGSAATAAGVASGPKGGSKPALWHEFVMRAIQCLRPRDSALVGVHPPGWRLPGGSNAIDFRQHGLAMRVLHAWGPKKSKKAFGATTTIDSYVAVRPSASAPPSPRSWPSLTVFAVQDGVPGTQGVTYADGMPAFVPSGAFHLWSVMLEEAQESGSLQVNETSASIASTGWHKFVSAISVTNGVRYISKNGRAHQHENEPKVLISTSPRPVAVVDGEGSVGTQGVMYVLCPTAIDSPVACARWLQRTAAWVNSPPFRCCNAAAKFGTTKSFSAPLSLMPVAPDTDVREYPAADDAKGWARFLKLDDLATEDLMRWWSGLTTFAKRPPELRIPRDLVSAGTSKRKKAARRRIGQRAGGIERVWGGNSTRVEPLFD